MYTTLAIFAAIVGLIVVGAAVYSAWYVTMYAKQGRRDTGRISGEEAEGAASVQHRQGADLQEGDTQGIAQLADRRDGPSRGMVHHAEGHPDGHSHEKIHIQPEQPDEVLAHGFLLRWSVFDYAVTLLSVCGLLFLLVDLVAVIRDHDSYPYYHYGYLLSGFVFLLIGTLFLFVRLSLALRMAGRQASFSPHDKHKPNQANQAE